MRYDLNAIISNGEGLMVEFKSTFNVAAIESVVAFANTKGGRILLGISDAGKVTGVEVARESIQQWANEIKSKTEPAVVPDMEIVTFRNKKIVVIQVSEYPVKPISVQGRFYKRVGSSNHLMGVAEISDLFMRSMQYSWDSYPYPNGTYKDLNLQSVKRFIAKVNSIGRFHLSTDPFEALTKLHLLRDGVPVNAAMLLFSKSNLLYNVHIGRFKTPSLIIADNMVNGNLYDVVDESMRIIISHLKFAFEITGKTTQRIEIPEYPLDAIREMLLNAVVHRNYQSPTDIQIKIFDRKIVFFNPSGLYGDITVDELKTDRYTASTRNKLIAEAFYLTNDIEKYGSGFIRIRQAIASYPTMKYDFYVMGNGCFSELSYERQKISTVEIEDGGLNGGLNGGLSGGLNERQKSVLQMIKETPGLNLKTVAEKTNIPVDTLDKYLRLLVKLQMVERRGSKKTGGYWAIDKITE